MWSRETLTIGRAHEERPEGLHLAWVRKYRKAVLVGEVAIRVRDLLRQIAAEHELEIVSRKVSGDHIHMFVAHWSKGGGEPTVVKSNTLTIGTGRFCEPTPNTQLTETL